MYSSRHYNESVNALCLVASHLSSSRPEQVALYNLRLYPISYERSALLAQLDFEEKHQIECAEQAYNEERERVEEEWKRGRERVRERLLEGIEERRRRAREEKDGEGTVGGTQKFSSPLHCTKTYLEPSQMPRWTHIRGRL